MRQPVRIQKPDVLVLGVGRSGTTTVARVLHERFGVCFGHHHTMYKWFRKERVYEDRHLKRKLEIVKRLGGVGWKSWLRVYALAHADCTAEYTGAKILDLVYMPVEAFEYVAPRLIVRTYRPFESCVESWGRYNKRSRKWNEARYVEREGLLSSLEDRVPMIRMEFEPEKKKWVDDEVEEVLRPAMVG